MKNYFIILILFLSTIYAQNGLEIANETIISGKALKKLNDLIKLSNS